MSRVPVINSPCPFRWSSMPAPGQDFCGQCQRQVHNLDLMSAEQRSDFMQSCSGEVCVSYTVRKPVSARKIALGLGLAASIASGSVGAQEETELKTIESKLVQATQDWNESESKEIGSVVVVGGTVLDPGTTRWVDETEVIVANIEELPQSTEMHWLETPAK